ncbi:MAG TPA: hypothetical protein VLJ68_07080 [Chitinophagaceae bacterium]|nr:hypothetical protein [Chitinophagaceae bacterium]
MNKLFLTLLAICSTGIGLFGQDTLPKFTLRNAGGNRIIVGWTNPYQNIRQLSIQRSFDSTVGFKSIMTLPDPTTPQNGYVDTKATNDHMYYRLYILLEKGFFLFSAVKKPVIDTTQTGGLTAIGKLVFGDSILNMNPNISGKNKNISGFTPSLYVFTSKDGDIRINLPEDPKSKFGIKFFDNDDNFLFEIKDVKARSFKLEKTDFYHAGWFKFELYEDGKLLEKHKFCIEKDF